jgi:subtilisin
MHVVNLRLSTRKHEYFGLFHELVDAAYFQQRHARIDGAKPDSTARRVNAAHDELSACNVIRERPAPPVEFGAPGISLDVAWLDHTTITATGNSFAAPHIAGLVALILSNDPGMTPFQMKTVL